MDKRNGLKSEYISVKRKNGNVLTFGGDQGFFNTLEGSKADKRKNASGCGIVAFSDLLLYLGKRGKDFEIQESKAYVNRILEEEEYKSYYNSVYSFLGGIPFSGGISGFKLFWSFNRIARKKGWKLRAKWGMSRKKLLPRIEEMLSRDIPVILCIPMMVRKKDKNEGLWLYHISDGSRAVFTKAHYVTITGMIQKNGILYYEISSWGKKYYINVSEYDALIHTHFMGTILGNILYIK